MSEDASEPTGIRSNDGNRHTYQPGVNTMKFERKLSVEGREPAEQIKWRELDVKLSDGSTLHAEVPASWSDTAAQILVTKYFRKAGVARDVDLYCHSEENVPSWLLRRRPGPQVTEFGTETSAKEVFHRLAGAWTCHGWRMGLFHGHEANFLDKFSNTKGYKETYIKKEDNPETNARIFYDELYLILARQLAAPNSPQFFNTGLWWAYGIDGPASGQWAISYDLSKAPRVFETSNAYEYPQPHACFIQPVTDDLVNPGGIMDLWTREVRLFKQGSGTGTNFSNIRAKGERLSGGGVSSGLMSFLEIGDRAAGSIASGGVTRRAAKMVVVDADHPEVEAYTDWKVREEQKAAAMWIGSKLATDPKLRALIPQEILDRVGCHLPTEELSIDYEGEAIRTVGGQNSNNTVRVIDAFMNLVEKDDGIWYLKPRNGNAAGSSVAKSLRAPFLWNKICRAAWASADPGLQFHDTINKWHTCKTDGPIRASNPCSEYMFLDNTACNLASLNLVKFYELKNLADPTSHEFNVDLFCHVARLMTIVLDISVSMASFPSREIALGSYNYRTLGLGYANLGGLLMRMGLPYDSNEGRVVASTITALMTGVSYITSSNLAAELGPFPRWEANKDSMLEVIGMHCDYLPELEDKDITRNMLVITQGIWQKVFEKGKETGFRNAQVTLLAPTGTIGLLMDCDTLGVEPDFALVKHKNLAGGGEMTLVNEGVPQALGKLDYKAHTANLILAYVREHGTVEGCPDLHPEHQSVFDCANPPSGFSRAIEPMGHVRMCAAVQPFLSGAISKTINMPASATVEDVSTAYMAAWKLGLKAVSIYRDGSKLAQPLSTAKAKPKVEAEGTYSPGVTEGYRAATKDLSEETKQVIAEATARTIIEDMGYRPGVNGFGRGVREYLPWRRQSAEIQKIKIGPSGQSLVLTLGRYPDGRLGEVYVELSRTGPTLHAFGNLLGMMISIGLQYGVPVDEYVKRLSGRQFEPSGLVEGHDQIKWAASIADYIARELGLTFLGDSSFAQVPAEPDAINDLFFDVHEEGSPERSEVVKKTKEQLERRQSQMLDVCPACGEAALVHSGTCKTCTRCGYNDGCGG